MIFYGFKLTQELFDAHKSRKIGGFFKVNCGVMYGDLRKYRKHYN
jgi:hypothetical protein